MKGLSELCTISSGLVFKRKEAPPDVSGFGYKLINLKSIQESGWINKVFLDDFISIEEIPEKYIANKGDIIVRLSSPFTAACVDESVEGSIITSLFAILRVNDSSVLPEYLSLVLNSEMMQRQYLREASGSALQMIKTSALKDYEVDIPAIEMQEIMININKLALKEIDLLNQLSEQKKLYNKLLINKLMEE